METVTVILASSEKASAFEAAWRRLGEKVTFRTAVNFVIEWAESSVSCEAIAYLLWQTKMNPDDDTFYVIASNFAYAFDNEGAIR